LVNTKLLHQRGICSNNYPMSCRSEASQVSIIRLYLPILGKWGAIVLVDGEIFLTIVEHEVTAIAHNLGGSHVSEQAKVIELLLKRRAFHRNQHIAFLYQLLQKTECLLLTLKPIFTAEIVP